MLVRRQVSYGWCKCESYKHDPNGSLRLDSRQPSKNPGMRHLFLRLQRELQCLFQHLVLLLQQGLDWTRETISKLNFNSCSDLISLSQVGDENRSNQTLIPNFSTDIPMFSFLPNWSRLHLGSIPGFRFCGQLRIHLAFSSGADDCGIANQNLGCHAPICTNEFNIAFSVEVFSGFLQQGALPKHSPRTILQIETNLHQKGYTKYNSLSVFHIFI